MEEQWNYEDKRDEGKVNRLKPIHGILLFIVVMVSFYTIIAWAQMRWGMYGLALTELYLLLLVLGSAKLLKVPFKEVFPVKKPQWQKVFCSAALLDRVLQRCDPSYHDRGLLFPKRDVFCQRKSE